MRIRDFVVACGLIILASGSANAFDAAVSSCNLCFCESGDLVCLDAIGAEAPEEQLVICNVACAEIGSEHGSRQFVETPCSDLPLCTSVGAPAAGPLWLGIGVVALLGLGAAGVRRARRRAAA
jgi:MYXO-CTERM domain-containing protein